MRSFTEVIRTIPHTPALTRIWSLVGVLVVYGTAVWVIDVYLVHEPFGIRTGIHTFLGIVLGLMLVFRTNTAYDRWWEGRKLWGQLVNDTRNLTLKSVALVGTTPAETSRLVDLLVAFSLALKDHLRGEASLEKLPGFEHDRARPSHVPGYIAQRMFDRLDDWLRDGRIDGYGLLVLDAHVKALMDICGACERILKSPLTYSYLQFLRQCIVIYLLTLPWALVDDFKYWEIPAVALIGYFLIGVELIAETVEEPFGRDRDDLPLEDICAGLERSLREIADRASVDGRHSGATASRLLSSEP